MRYTCPRCGAAYNVTPEHLGRHVICQQCQMRLVVGPHGFAPMEGRGGAESDPAYQSVPRATEPAMNRLDIGSLVLACGAILIVVFLFFNVLDGARINYAQAEIRTKETIAQKRAETAQREGGADGHREGEKLRKDWEAEKARLEEELTHARLDNAWRTYLYNWGLMLGFASVAVASVLYIATGPTLTRRVTGSVLLCSELLLVFFAVVVTSLQRLPAL